MTSKVLAKVFQFAVNGDIGAAKLYFNVIDIMNGQSANNTLIQNQNNYIQINGTILSQETIKNLNPEQLNSIETILKTAIHHREAMKAKIGLPSPAWLLKFGAVIIKTEPELILKSRWVVPEKLLQSGYIFKYPTLDIALRNILTS